MALSSFYFNIHVNLISQTTTTNCYAFSNAANIYTRYSIALKNVLSMVNGYTRQFWKEPEEPTHRESKY